MNTLAIKDIFDDYAQENIGKSICIELEVADRDAYAIKRKFNETHPYRESYKIYEILYIHKLGTEERKQIYNSIRSIYRSKFPMGANKYISGGVHFHAFFKKPILSPLEDKLNFKLNEIRYHANFLSLPLFCKVKDFTFFARPGQEIDNGYDKKPISTDRQPTGSIRSYFRSHHSQQYPDYRSIEFRCNNVIDTRLYGYYIGQLLLAEAGIDLEPVSKAITDVSYQSDATYVLLKDLSEKGYGVDLSSEEDKGIIRRNLKIMLLMLRRNGFKEAAKQLRIYAKTHKIL